MSNELLPCPFCGSSDYLEISREIRPGKLNRLGQTNRRAEIHAQVMCYECGASGPAFRFSESGDFNIADAMVNDALAQAALMWNSRHPFGEAVNSAFMKIMHAAIEMAELQRTAGI